MNRVAQKGRADMGWWISQEPKPDLVMTGDDTELRLLWARFADSDMPVVYFGINNNAVYILETAFAGT